MAKWRESLTGSFPSRLEKLLGRLTEQRKSESAANVRAFLAKKIAMLKEILDGPVPAPIVPTVGKNGIVVTNRPLTDAELLEGAQYLVKIKKEKLMTPQQRAALEKARKK